MNTILDTAFYFGAGVFGLYISHNKKYIEKMSSQHGEDFAKKILKVARISGYVLIAAGFYSIFFRLKKG